MINNSEPIALHFRTKNQKICDLFPFLILGLIPGIGYLAPILLSIFGCFFINRPNLCGDKLFVVLIIQYLIFNIFLLLVFRVSPSFTEDYFDTKMQMYFGFTLLLFPILSAFRQSNATSLQVYQALSIGLLIAATGHLIVFSAPPNMLNKFLEIPDTLFANTCRPTIWRWNPLVPPTLLGALLVLSISLRSQLLTKKYILFTATFSAVWLSVITVHAGRMSIYALGLTLLLFITYQFYTKKIAQMIILSLILLLTLTAGISMDRCGVFRKMDDTIETLNYIFSERPEIHQLDTLSAENFVGTQTPKYIYNYGSSDVIQVNLISHSFNFHMDQKAATRVDFVEPLDLPSSNEIRSQGVPSSEADRWSMWLSGITAVAKRPILGYGPDREKEVINIGAQTHHPHVHNQYLSWLVQGGFIGFLSGLIFLTSPILALKKIRLNNVSVWGLAPLALNNITDTQLFTPQVLGCYLTILCALYAIDKKGAHD